MRRAGRITRQGAGKPISAAMLRDLAAGVVRRVSGVGVRATSREDGSLTISADRQLRRVGMRLMEVQTIETNYLSCLRVTNGATTPGAVSVLKPQELLHDLAYYPLLTSLVTVDAQTVTASDGSTTETWQVTPDYVVGAWILACQVWTGEVDGAAAPIDWMDANTSGRAWAVA